MSRPSQKLRNVGMSCVVTVRQRVAHVFVRAPVPALILLEQQHFVVIEAVLRA